MKNNKKGFTLAELLVVVGIIAVLIAIAIPVFTSQLEKSKEAVDAANIRTKYAELMNDVLTDSVKEGADAYKVSLKQAENDWQDTALKNNFPENMTLSGTPGKGGAAVLTYDKTTKKVACALSAATN